jgi:hypothetical protein
MLSALRMTESDHTSSQDAEQGHPPDVPDIERRVRLYPRQALGLILLATVPILAMLGLLSERQTRDVAATPSLQVEAEYPTRLRVTRHAVLRVEATNRSGSTLDRVRVLLPEPWAVGFADRELARAATADGEIAFPPLGPGESRTVHVDLLAHRPGRHRGTLRVIPSPGDTLTLALSTLILP